MWILIKQTDLSLPMSGTYIIENFTAGTNDPEYH
jgi:hypothetical protein